MAKSDLCLLAFAMWHPPSPSLNSFLAYALEVFVHPHCNALSLLQIAKEMDYGSVLLRYGSPVVDYGNA